MRAFFGFPLVMVLASCNARSIEEPAPRRTTIAECDAYVAAHTACFARLGHAGQEIGKDRAASMRAAFRPPDNPDEVEKLRKQCTAGTEQLIGRCR